MKHKNIIELSTSERLERLERQNLIFKLVILFMFILILGAGVASWRFQNDGEISKQFEKSFRTQEIVIIDSMGNEFIKISGSKIEFFDKKQNVTSRLDGKSIEIINKGKMVLNPSVFSFYRESEKGEIPAATFYPLVPEWTFYDPKGSGRFIINLNRFGIYYFDPEKRSSISLNSRGINYYNGENQKESTWP